MTCACCQERPAIELGLCQQCAEHEVLRRHFGGGIAQRNGWEPLLAVDDVALEEGDA